MHWDILGTFISRDNNIVSNFTTLNYLAVTIPPADTCILALEKLRRKRRRDFYRIHAQSVS